MTIVETDRKIKGIETLWISRAYGEDLEGNWIDVGKRALYVRACRLPLAASTSGKTGLRENVSH